ncbi:uncharacterized protein BDW70DRAFT_128713 [Aspergillus foveolatus]|uniref:uncharacterized protein n=1 Tax=Aspergillus foveolatus TaxID=210207 RepID=UPI003CCE4ECE
MWNLSCILILERLAVYLYSVLCTLSMHKTALSISPRFFDMPQKDARRQWKRRMRRLSLPEGPAALSDRGKAALDPDKLVDYFSFRGAKRGQALAKESQHSSIPIFIVSQRVLRDLISAAVRSRKWLKWILIVGGDAWPATAGRPTLHSLYRPFHNLIALQTVDQLKASVNDGLIVTLDQTDCRRIKISAHQPRGTRGKTHPSHS